MDVEHALDPEYSKKLGVNVEDLLVSQPSSGEEALRIVETLVRDELRGTIRLAQGVPGTEVTIRFPRPEISEADEVLGAE